MLRDRIRCDSRYRVRRSTAHDLAAIRLIYNQGIEDRIATLDAEPKTTANIDKWYGQHDDRYCVIVATNDDDVVGWAALNRYSHRCAHDSVADLSIYVRRDKRGSGVGSLLMREIEEAAKKGGFHKIVLFAFPTNAGGRQLYLKSSFRDVGIFREQGTLDGEYVDVIAMEKILRP